MHFQLMVAKPMSVKNDRGKTGLASPEPKLTFKKSQKTNSASPPKKRKKKGHRESFSHFQSKSNRKRKFAEDEISDSLSRPSAGKADKINHIVVKNKSSSGNIDLSYQTRNSRIKQPN